jgi:hypothetical protein
MSDTPRMGQLIRVTTVAINRPEKSLHYIVAEYGFEKAAAILKPALPAGAKIESLGNIPESLLGTLRLVPGQFTEV